MKIMKRQEFLATPEGTLYQEYKPCVFGDLQIKFTLVGNNDFIVQDLTAGAIKCRGSGDCFELQLDAMETGSSLEMDFDCCGREGIFPDDDALYAVWEKSDIMALIQKLAECLS